MIEEAILKGRELAYENRLEGKDLDELDELEEDEDEAFLEIYRQQRMKEMNALALKSKYGSVYPISKPDYAREVTEASANAPVLVNLTSGMGTNIESRILTELWREAAKEFGEVKFCEIRGDQAIEGYPDKNCPTILVYKDGNIVKQIVTLAMLDSLKTSMKNIDSLLIEVGAVKPNDIRIMKRRREAEEEAEAPRRSGLRGSTLNKNDDEDDEDWD